jgi:hypothetical protein
LGCALADSGGLSPTLAAQNTTIKRQPGAAWSYCGSKSAAIAAAGGGSGGSGSDDAMRSAARPSLEGDSAAKAIGAEPIGRTMKQSFCDGAIAGKGIVKAIDDARRSFCDHSANAIGAEPIGRMMRRLLSRRWDRQGTRRSSKQSAI